MKEITLSRGKVALIDDEDFERVSRHTWCAVGKSGNYARSKAGDRGPDKRRRPIYLHRMIMDARPGQTVDHINGNGLDNRRCNLRFATQGQNCRNSRKPQTYRGLPTTSKYKGVHRNKKSGRWLAAIRRDGIAEFLGSFPSEEMAAKAYDKAAKKFHKKFARLNMPDGKPTL